MRSYNEVDERNDDNFDLSDLNLPKEVLELMAFTLESLPDKSIPTSVIDACLERCGKLITDTVNEYVGKRIMSDITYDECYSLEERYNFDLFHTMDVKFSMDCNSNKEWYIVMDVESLDEFVDDASYRSEPIRLRRVRNTVDNEVADFITSSVDNSIIDVLVEIDKCINHVGYYDDDYDDNYDDDYDTSFRNDNRTNNEVLDDFDRF